MPTSGAYTFRLAAKAVDGFVEDAHELEKGEWAWIDRTVDYQGADGPSKDRWLMIYALCPDCGQPMTLYRRRNAGEPQGHTIDVQGNIHPSVLHSWKVKGVECCGFHTMPTRLLGFVEKRKAGA